MKIFIKSLFLILFFSCLSNAEDNVSNKSEKYFKFGVFDFKHLTDMTAINIKSVTDNNLELPYFGEFTQIYDFMLMADIQESFSDELNKANREEYAMYFSSGYQKKLSINDSIIFVPSFSVGLYNEFDQGKDMGLPIQFKSEVELNYKTKNDLVFGVTYNHISNADIGDKNPGSDSYFIGIKYKP